MKLNDSEGLVWCVQHEKGARQAGSPALNGQRSTYVHTAGLTDYYTILYYTILTSLAAISAREASSNHHDDWPGWLGKEICGYIDIFWALY